MIHDLIKNVNEKIQEARKNRKIIDEESYALYPDLQEFISDEYDKKIKEYINIFEANGVDIQPYLRNNEVEKFKIDDDKLNVASYLLDKDNKFTSRVAEDLLGSYSTLENETFKDIAFFCSSNDTACNSIEEIKKGLEEGLNINEIALVLGKNSNETHKNRKIYTRYRDFFKGKIQDGYVNELKAFLNACRINDKKIPQEMVLYAQTADDLKLSAPVTQISSELQQSISEGSIDVSNAYFISYKANGECGDILFRCFSPHDGDVYDTTSEYEAMFWVRNKNNNPKIVPVSKQIYSNKSR